jgi:YlmC/YmxH family sporulation protein
LYSSKFFIEEGSKVVKTSELKMKEVININDGQRLGVIKDIELNLIEGRIKSIIVPGEKKVFNFLSGKNDLVIGWKQIEKIGKDVILVNLDNFTNPNNGRIE